jgi:Ca2+-transporting ATPase
MIVADDNFATIFFAVEYGRIIYNNLQNILLFVLTTSLGGILTILTSILIGLPLPFFPVQILWINLVTDATSTVPLAFEEGDRDVIYLKPRDPRSGLISAKMAFRMFFTAITMSIVVLVLFKYELETHIGLGLAYAEQYARTVAFTTFALLQIVNAHNCRSQTKSLFSIGIFKNRYLLGVHGITVPLQIIMVETPIGWTAFNTTSLGFGWNSGWIEIIAINVMLVVMIEFLKFIERKYGKK